MVIGATALFKTAVWLEQFSGQAQLAMWTHYLAIVELIIATAVVLYVSIRYLLHYLPSRTA